MAVIISLLLLVSGLRLTAIALFAATVAEPSSFTLIEGGITSIIAAIIVLVNIPEMEIGNKGMRWFFTVIAGLFFVLLALYFFALCAWGAENMVITIGLRTLTFLLALVNLFPSPFLLYWGLES